MTDAIWTAKRDVRTFAELSHAADILMQTSKEYRRGNLYTAMASLLLRTFTFEAYLNHLGERHLKLWTRKDRIGWHGKFTKVCVCLNYAPEESVRPYSTLRPLYIFRNMMAHGWSETIEEVKEVNSLDADKPFWPLTEWEKFCTPEIVERANEDITAIINELHKRTGLSDDPFAPPEAHGSLRLKKP